MSMGTAEAVRVRGDQVPIPAVWKRLGSAVVLIPVFVWLLASGPAVLFVALVVVLSAAASWEVERMLGRAGHATGGPLAVVASAALTASFGVSDRLPAVVLTIAILAALAAPLARPGALSIEPAATTLLSIGYVGWLLGYAILLRNVTNGPALILFLVGVTWVGESAAYAVGNAIGRHHLAPVVSPNKTMEGAVGQVVASLIAAVVLRPWLAPAWTVWSALGAGLLLGIVGQVGDLAESVIKRSLGAKDTSGLIPGHGGVLDRLDSLLFSAPAFYYFVVWAEGLR
jgi:phosphatidate cytidylyltransferase